MLDEMTRSGEFPVHGDPAYALLDGLGIPRDTPAPLTIPDVNLRYSKVLSYDGQHVRSHRRAVRDRMEIIELKGIRKRKVHIAFFSIDPPTQSRKTAFTAEQIAFPEESV